MHPAETSWQRIANKIKLRIVPVEKYRRYSAWEQHTTKALSAKPSSGSIR